MSIYRSKQTNVEPFYTSTKDGVTRSAYVGGTVIRHNSYSATSPWRKYGSYRIERPLPGFEGQTYGKSKPVAIVIRKAAKH